MPAQGIRGTSQVHRVAQNDNRVARFKATGLVALLLEASIPDFAQPTEEHRSGQRIAPRVDPVHKQGNLDIPT